MDDTHTQESKIILDGKNYHVEKVDIETEEVDIRKFIPWHLHYEKINEFIATGKTDTCTIQKSTMKVVATDITTAADLAKQIIDKIGKNIEVCHNTSRIIFRGKIWDIQNFFKQDDDTYFIEAEQFIHESIIEKRANEWLKM